jgi:hypothetical protein
MKLDRSCLVVVALLGTVACKKETPPTAAAAASGSAGALAAAPAASSLAILEGFEGEVTLHVKAPPSARDAAKDLNVALLVKDGKFRVDLPEGLEQTREIGKAFVLVEPTEKKLYAVMDAKKQAVMLDFDKLATQAKAMSSRMHPPGGTDAAAAGTPPVVQKTGKTETVAGYSCEIWHVAQGKSSGDLCIASQGASWFHIPLAGLPAEYAWASELADGQHFPLRLVAFENGIEQGRLEVTSIAKKTLPATDFEVPAGYNIMDLDQMMGAMMGGMAGMMPPGAMRPGMPGMPGMPPGAMPPHGKPSKHK